MAELPSRSAKVVGSEDPARLGAQAGQGQQADSKAGNQEIVSSWNLLEAESWQKKLRRWTGSRQSATDPGLENPAPLDAFGQAF